MYFCFFIIVDPLTNFFQAKDDDFSSGFQGPFASIVLRWLLSNHHSPSHCPSRSATAVNRSEDMSSMQTSGAPVPVLPVGDAGAGAKKTETEQAGTTETAKPLSTETSTGEPAKTTDEPAKETSASGTAGASSGASSSDADADANPFKAGGSGPALIAGLPIPLPEGWISEYDEESKQWFFVSCFCVLRKSKEVDLRGKTRV